MDCEHIWIDKGTFHKRIPTLPTQIGGGGSEIYQWFICSKCHESKKVFQ